MNRQIPVRLMRRFVSFVAAAFLSLNSCLSSGAGLAVPDYPKRPIRLISPFPPGGGNDTMARAIGAKLAEAWGQQIVVDNRTCDR